MEGGWLTDRTRVTRKVLTNWSGDVEKVKEIHMHYTPLQRQLQLQTNNQLSDVLTFACEKGETPAVGQ